MRPVRVFLLASTAGLAALALHAALRGEPGLAVCGVLSLAWFAFLTTGVLFPGLEMYAPIASRGRAGGSRVALTFDDGPHPVTTRRVLEIFAATRHRATFFVLGDKVRRHPDVVREIRAGGHSVGIHGDFHDRFHSFRMPWTVRDQLVRAGDAVEAATGVRPRFFRPPWPHQRHDRARRAPRRRHAGRLVVARPGRPRVRTAEACLARVRRTLDDGASVMLHDAAEYDDFEPAAVRALPQLLALLDERGLTSVGLDALLGEPAAPARPGLPRNRRD